MRKLLWIVPVLTLIAAIGATTAHATVYTPTFTCGGTCAFLATAPDVSFPSPTSITVTWDSTVFVVPLAASDLPTDSYFWSGMVIDFPGDPAATLADFAILDLTTHFQTEIFIPAPQLPPLHAGSSGSLTFSAVTTPEPSSFALMLAGVGLLFVMRKRLAKCVQQAS